nr:restriction endonuclease subunit S [Micromonospora sp. DSM 115978]
MTELPPSWKLVTLGEIADTSLGKMLDRAKGLGRNHRPYLRNGNVQWGRIDESDILTMEIPPDQEEKYRLRAGDLLVCEGGDVGRCAIWRGGDDFMAFQKALHRVRPLGGIEPRYIRYLLECLSLRGGLAKFATGSTIKHLPQEQLRALPIPLPPLLEQRRIAAVLEDQLSRLEVGRGLLETAGRRINILQKAFLGQLDAELSNEPVVTLGQMLAEPLRNGHSAPVVNGEGVRAISLTAVTKGQFVDNYTKMTSADPAKVRDLWLRPGDILVQRSNTPELVGTAAMYEGPNDWAIFPDLLIRVRVSSRVLPEYAALMLSRPAARRYFRRSAKGLAGSMPKIDQRTILSAEFPLPNLERQAKIIEDSKNMAGRLSRLESARQIAETRAAFLRSALLAEAFAGRLVPQDPSDEPASELLARIRVEREAAGAVKRVARQRVGRAGDSSGRTRKVLAAPPTRVTDDQYEQGELPL